MNNSTITKDNSKSVVSIFAEMTDQRKPKGVRYQLQPLIILLSLAKLCDQDTPSEISDWAKNRQELLKEKLDLHWKRMPSQSTWQRLIGGNIDAVEFDQKVSEYFQTLSSEERQLYNLDGKVVRGTVEKDTSEQLYLLALQEQKTNLVIEQTEIKRGENEITGAKRLFERADLSNKIVSGDALLCSTGIIQKSSFGRWRISVETASQSRNYLQTGKTIF